MLCGKYHGIWYLSTCLMKERFRPNPSPVPQHQEVLFQVVLQSSRQPHSLVPDLTALLILISLTRLLCVFWLIDVLIGAVSFFQAVEHTHSSVPAWWHCWGGFWPSPSTSHRYGKSIADSPQGSQGRDLDLGKPLSYTVPDGAICVALWIEN